MQGAWVEGCRWCRWSKIARSWSVQSWPGTQPWSWTLTRIPLATLATPWIELGVLRLVVGLDGALVQDGVQQRLGLSELRQLAVHHHQFLPERRHVGAGRERTAERGRSGHWSSPTKNPTGRSSRPDPWGLARGLAPLW